MSPINEEQMAERMRKKAEEENIFVEGYKNVKVKKKRKIVKGDSSRILIDLEDDNLEVSDSTDPLDQLFD